MLLDDLIKRLDPLQAPVILSVLLYVLIHERFVIFYVVVDEQI